MDRVFKDDVPTYNWDHLEDIMNSDPSKMNDQKYGTPIIRLVDGEIVEQSEVV